MKCKSSKTNVVFLVVVVLFPALFSMYNCAKEKVIIYKPLTDSVTLIYPPDTDLIFASAPELTWSWFEGAVSYQLHVANDVNFIHLVVSGIVNDTSYIFEGALDNDRYFWRVRAKNNQDVWGLWSDALIWSFIINDNSDYFALASIIQTPGIPQDVFIEGNLAYVADGQSDLTIIDVSNPSNPSIIGNVDIGFDDFAKAVWKRPDEDYAYIADMDYKIQVIDVKLPLDSLPFSNNYGLTQNVEELDGLVYQDTTYIFAVSSGFMKRELNFYQFINDPFPIPNEAYFIAPYIFPADAKGVLSDTMTVTVEYRDIDTLNNIDSTYYETQHGMFIFVALSEAGLWWFNVSHTHTFDETDSLLLRDPRLLGWDDTPYVSLSVYISAGFAYIADDRGGLQIFDLPDTIPSFDHDLPYSADPVLIADINTAGRAKDVHVVGNYCYLADGSGGLKVCDIADPYNPILLAAYDTPYAYGIWADESYIYITDRDNGLMIFENLLF